MSGRRHHRTVCDCACLPIPAFSDIGLVAMVGVFIPWKSTKAPNEGFAFQNIYRLPTALKSRAPVSSRRAKGRELCSASVTRGWWGVQWDAQVTLGNTGMYVSLETLPSSSVAMETGPRQWEGSAGWSGMSRGGWAHTPRSRSRPPE